MIVGLHSTERFSDPAVLSDDNRDTIRQLDYEQVRHSHVKRAAEISSPIKQQVKGETLLRPKESM